MKSLPTVDERVLKLARASLKRFGFVVVAYHPRMKPRKGEKVQRLWTYTVQQRFVVEKKATEQEWREQLALFEKLFKKPPSPTPGFTHYVRLRLAS